MIALVDHGVGNMRSVQKSLAAVGADVILTANPEEILRAEKVVLPGVGAFGDAMAGLRRFGLEEVIHQIAALNTPLLGICVGMQMLFEYSLELGMHPGLGLLPGKVVRFGDDQLKIPHTGWNQILIKRSIPLMNGVESGSYAYFNHSYYCDPMQEADVVGETEYGLAYASVVGRDNLYGVQFHPEKSQSVGLQILKNFVELC